MCSFKSAQAGNVVKNVKSINGYRFTLKPNTWIHFNNTYNIVNVNLNCTHVLLLL